MKVINVRQTINASSTNSNILNGLLYQQVPSAGSVSYYLAASATGLQASITLGGEVLCQSGDVQVEEAADVGPNTKIHFMGSDGAEGNEDQVIAVTNTTAGALVITGKVLIEEVSVI